MIREVWKYYRSKKKKKSVHVERPRAKKEQYVIEKWQKNWGVPREEGVEQCEMKAVKKRGGQILHVPIGYVKDRKDERWNWKMKIGIHLCLFKKEPFSCKYKECISDWQDWKLGNMSGNVSSDEIPSVLD